MPYRIWLYYFGTNVAKKVKRARANLLLLLVVEEEHVEFEPVVSPGTKLERALLDVEREIDDVDGAGGLEDGRRHPEDVAVRRDDCHRVTVFLQSLIGTAKHSGTCSKTSERCGLQSSLLVLRQRDRQTDRQTDI